MYDNEAYVAEALRCGARAYVLKGSTSSDLLTAIHAALAGRIHLSPPLSERAVEAYAKMITEEAVDPFEGLTAREREVLHLTVNGGTSTQIAKKLNISSRTVETHRSNLMHKLGLHSQADLIRYALERGVVIKRK